MRHRLFFLCLLLSAPAGAQSYLQEVPAAERARLQAQLKSASREVAAQAGHWTRPSMPSPVATALQSAGRLTRVYHLRGDQASALLTDCILELNPRVSAAAPALQRLQAMMAAHHVSGSALYDYMEPIVEMGVEARLSGQNPPTPSLSDVQRANAFASQNGLSLTDMVGCLKELRSAISH